MNNYKILVIDDDPDLVSSVSAILKGNDFDTVTAKSGNEGIKAYKDDNPDLVLCDMMMEHVDEGTKVAAKIRETDKEIPIYLLSSIGDATANNINPRDLGFNGVIQKPVEPVSLITTIKKALKS